MCKLTKISTKDMPREEWLEYRRKSIGGSDAGAILGLNKYTSAYALWAEKTGTLIPEDISDKEAVRLGNDLEQYVADRWMEATGKKLRRENNILYNPEYPWAHANIDRAVIGEPDAGFEAKTTSSYDVLQQCEDGRFPDSWYCQMTHYMMVTGAKRWYLGVLVFGHGFYHFTIERNEAEIEALAAAEQEFWELVQNHTPPAADGSSSSQETLRAIFRDSDGSSCDLNYMAGDIQTYAAACKQIKELEQARDQAQARIMQAMGSCEKGTGAGYKITWKTQSRSTFDRKAYENVYGPIPAAFLKQGSTRPFRVTSI